MKFPLTLISHGTNIDFIGKRCYAFAFSIGISILTLVLLFTKGLNLGIDFTGGIVMETRSEKPVEIHHYREVLAHAGYEGASLQNFGEAKDVLIRLQAKNTDAQSKEVEHIKSLLMEKIDPKIEFRKVDYVGPKVGRELIENGIKALLLSLVGIMIYTAFRFSWQFGLGAIVSLFHDAWITLGFYIISGFEFDLTSVAALLIIVGYSINDTVVIYDRIRENIRKYKVVNLADIINRSVNETLSRTVMTVLTTLIAALALVIFGGDVIKGFSTAMFFGIAFGTYSSIYIAAPVLMHTGFKSTATA
jgi:preprotein translocase SecF subunit